MHVNKNENMTPHTRRQYITMMIQKSKFVDVKVLADTLFVAEATIRRDLNKLEKAGILKRTYGGAMLLEGLDKEIPLYARENQNNEAKDYICKIAASYVKDGDTIVLDSSTTTARMVRYLKGKENLKIITNGAKTALLLSELTNVTIYCTGGKLRENSLSYVGSSAIEYINNFSIDICFFSCRGLSEKGLTDSSEEEAVLRRTMIKNSKTNILLINSGKIGEQSFYLICEAEKVDYIICEKPVPNIWG